MGRRKERNKERKDERLKERKDERAREREKERKNEKRGGKLIRKYGSGTEWEGEKKERRK